MGCGHAPATWSASSSRLAAGSRSVGRRSAPRQNCSLKRVSRRNGKAGRVSSGAGGRATLRNGFSLRQGTFPFPIRFRIVKCSAKVERGRAAFEIEAVEAIHPPAQGIRIGNRTSLVTFFDFETLRDRGARGKSWCRIEYGRSSVQSCEPRLGRGRGGRQINALGGAGGPEKSD